MAMARSGEDDFGEDAASMVPVAGRSTGQQAVETGVDALMAVAMRKVF